MDRRVKLVFADELGRFLLRERGFSSCWFLVPPSAKLVGDLAHEIRHEFGLSVARCPSGVDLVLQQLHLLPSHDIRIVRDNDEICVQCSTGVLTSAASGLRQRSDEQALLEATRSDEQQQQQEKSKKRRDKNGKKQLAVVATSAQNEKKARKELKKAKREDRKRVAAVAKARDTSAEESSSGSSDSEEEGKKQLVVLAPKSKKRKAITPPPPPPSSKSSTSSSSSSSSSGSDSSDSDSSSSDSGDEGKKQRSAKKAPLLPERKRQRMEVSKASQQALKPAPGKKEATVNGKMNGVGEQRQRRRRRPRNRKPREERIKRPQEDGGAAIAIQSVALPTPGSKPANPLALLPPPVAAPSQPEQQHAESPESIGAETSSIVNGHVRFGDAGESQVVPKSTTSNSSGSDTLHIRKPRAYVSPELQKYGPPETSSNRNQHRQQQRPVAPKDHGKQQQRQQHPNGQQRHREVSPAQPLQNADTSTATKTKKKQWGDMWKRPYEIVATIHGQPNAQSDEARLSARSNLLRGLFYAQNDIPRLLTTFPPPASDIPATWFQIGDIVAYKTLSLCMETWQPIASEWLCGKVRSVSGSSEVEVQPMTLSTRKDGESETLLWTPRTGAQSESSVSVQIGEVSEIRYLESPGFQTQQGQSTL